MKNGIIELNKKEMLELEQEFNYSDMIEKYLNYIDVSKNSEKTYHNALKQFVRYIYLNDIKTPTREDIIQYKEELKKYNKATTVNLYLVAIKNFYKWLEYEGITKDITKNIKLIKVNNEHTKQALTLEQIENMINICKDIREKVIIVLTFSCGLRINELVNIELQDFKEKNGKTLLYLLGKGRDYKQDFVIVPDNIVTIIKKYVKEYNIKDYLFISTSNNNKGGKLTTKTIRFIVKNILKKCDITSNEYSFHSLRHSFATESIKCGIDIREVSQALRHKNIQTTTIYIHDLEKTNNKCSNSVANLLNI